MGRIPHNKYKTGPSPWPPYLVMICATAFFGASGGVLAGLAINGFAAAAIVELTTGILLTSLAAIQGQRLRPAFRALRKYLPLLAVAESGNIALYYIALQHGPLVPVMAMHLTAPVVLSVVAILRRQRHISIRGLAPPILISTAVAVLCLSGFEEKPTALCSALY